MKRIIYILLAAFVLTMVPTTDASAQGKGTSRKRENPVNRQNQVEREEINMVSPQQQIQQEASSEDDKVYDVVEQQPRFPENISAWLAKNIQYPPVAEENGIQGRVVVTCVIDHDGSVTDVKVVKSVDPSLDKEALRVVKRMPKWEPGRQNGKTVRVKYTMPVNFKLQ